MKKINFIEPILTSNKPKNYIYESKNIEELIDLIDEGSQKIFSFKIPKDSIYVNIYNYKEFIAINMNNEFNKLAGYTMNELDSFSEKLKDTATVLGYHGAIYRNKGLAHLLKVALPESNSLEEYYSFVHAITHEIGHSAQENYLNRKNQKLKNK